MNMPSVIYPRISTKVAFGRARAAPSPDYPRGSPPRSAASHFPTRAAASTAQARRPQPDDRNHAKSTTHPSLVSATRTSSPTFNRPMHAVQQFSDAATSRLSSSITRTRVTGSGAGESNGSSAATRIPRRPPRIRYTSAATKSATRKSNVRYSSPFMGISPFRRYG